MARSTTREIREMVSSDMMDVDVFALFPGNRLTDKVNNHTRGLNQRWIKDI